MTSSGALRPRRLITREKREGESSKCAYTSCWFSSVWLVFVVVDQLIVKQLPIRLFGGFLACHPRKCWLLCLFNASLFWYFHLSCKSILWCCSNTSFYVCFLFFYSLLPQLATGSLFHFCELRVHKNVFFYGLWETTFAIVRTCLFYIFVKEHFRRPQAILHDRYSRLHIG